MRHADLRHALSHIEQAQDGRHKLGKHCGRRHTCNAHVHDHDKNQVKGNIHQRGNDQEEQRHKTASKGAKNGSLIVVECGGRRSSKKNRRVKHCSVQKLLRRADQAKQLPAAKQPNRRNAYGERQYQVQAVRNGTARKPSVACAVMLRNHHGHSRRHANDQSQQKLRDRVGSADSGQRLRAHAASDHRRIHHTV